MSSMRCRQILSILGNKSLSSSEIISALGDDAPKYRQTVNKILSKLESCELVRKDYDHKEKHLMYSLTVKEIIIKFNYKNLQIEPKN